MRYHGCQSPDNRIKDIWWGQPGIRATTSGGETLPAKTVSRLHEAGTLLDVRICPNAERVNVLWRNKRDDEDFCSWKGWDVTDNLLGDSAISVEAALMGQTGGYMGTIHEQRFFAIRANGADLRFPFPSGDFTVLVDMAASVDDAVLKAYAEALIEHGCVQAVCRGEESTRLEKIFNKLAEKGDLDKNGTPFTSMCIDDEPLEEAIQYFVLPCGLAYTGLLMVIGDQGDFQNAIQGFSTAAGAIKDDIGEPVYTEDDLVCFVSS